MEQQQSTPKPESLMSSHLPALPTTTPMSAAEPQMAPSLPPLPARPDDATLKAANPLRIVLGDGKATLVIADLPQIIGAGDNLDDATDEFLAELDEWLSDPDHPENETVFKEWYLKHRDVLRWIEPPEPAPALETESETKSELEKRNCKPRHKHFRKPYHRGYRPLKTPPKEEPDYGPSGSDTAFPPATSGINRDGKL